MESSSSSKYHLTSWLGCQVRMFGARSSRLQNNPDVDGGTVGCALRCARGHSHLVGHALDILLDVVLSMGQSCRAQGWRTWSLHFLLPDCMLGPDPSVPCPHGLKPASRSICLRKGRLRRPRTVCAPVGPRLTRWAGPGDGGIGWNSESGCLHGCT